MNDYEEFCAYLDRYDPDGMDWNEYAHEDAGKALESWFSQADWDRLEMDWINKPEKWQILLAGLLPIVQADRSFHPTSKKIVTDMMLATHDDLSAEAAHQYWFYARSRRTELEDLKKRPEFYKRISALAVKYPKCEPFSELMKALY